MGLHYHSMTAHEGSASAATIRARLPHPVVDGDGHLIEYFPALAGYLREEGVDPAGPEHAAPPARPLRARPGLVRRQPRGPGPPPHRPPAVVGGARPANTRDLATAFFPRLLHERLDELGIDVSVVYPSMGLAFLHLEDADERGGACRALNRYNADRSRRLGDRLVPVAAIPMHTPEEAVAELDHAVTELGFKAVLMAGYVQRTVAGVSATTPTWPWAVWIDTYGIDSPTTTTRSGPAAASCRSAGPSTPAPSAGAAGSRSSSYMATTTSATSPRASTPSPSRSSSAGSPGASPSCAFAFLEGGVAWAASLYADLVGHWEKRNVEAHAPTSTRRAIDRATARRARSAQLRRRW